MHATRQPEIILTNRLLAALLRAEFERLAPHLHRVKLARNRILYDAGDEVHRAYFLQNGLISLIPISGNNESIEAGFVGREGMGGIPASCVTDARLSALSSTPLQILW